MSPAKHILHCLAYKCGIFLWGLVILDNLKFKTIKLIIYTSIKRKFDRLQNHRMTEAEHRIFVLKYFVIFILTLVLHKRHKKRDAIQQVIKMFEKKIEQLHVDAVIQQER